MILCTMSLSLKSEFPRPSLVRLSAAATLNRFTSDGRSSELVCGDSLRPRAGSLELSACLLMSGPLLPPPGAFKKKNLIRCEGIKWQMRTDRCMHFLFACLPGDRPLLLLLLRSSWYILLVEEGGVGGGGGEKEAKTETANYFSCLQAESFVCTCNP